LALDALVRLTRCYGGNKNLWRARSASRSGGRRRAFRTHWLNHPRRSAQAPGAPEEFVGSSATFVSCVWLIRHVAAFGNAVLEIIPLRLCIGPPRWLVRVGLDRQRATLLRKLRADWTGALRAIRRRGFSPHGRCGKKQHDEHCEKRCSRGVHTLRPQASPLVQ
jgi:hypothetical protein